MRVDFGDEDSLNMLVFRTFRKSSSSSPARKRSISALFTHFFLLHLLILLLQDEAQEKKRLGLLEAEQANDDSYAEVKREELALALSHKQRSAMKVLQDHLHLLNRVGANLGVLKPGLGFGQCFWFLFEDHLSPSLS